MNVQKFTRGSVWWYNRYTNEQGITRGTHPCVVISSDDWNDKAGSVVIVPCTSDKLKGVIATAKLELGQTAGYMFPTQITTVPKSSLYNYQGVLDSNELNTLTTALNSILIDANSGIDSSINTNSSTPKDSIARPNTPRYSHGGYTNQNECKDSYLSSPKRVGIYGTMSNQRYYCTFNK